MEDNGTYETLSNGKNLLSDIIVKKDNEVNIRIDCDRGIAREIYDRFSFYVPGYKYMPAYKSRMWDGKIRLFNVNTQRIYKGLIGEVKKFARLKDYTIEIQDDLDVENEFSAFECGQFVQSIKTKHIPRDYQIDGFVNAVRKNRALLLSPTGSGKSLIIYLLTRFYPHKKLIIVPTISLVQQLAKDFEDYNQGPFEVLKITGDTDKSWQKKIDSKVVITTWQSIHKQPRAFYDQFGVVIGDEAHTFKAKSLTSILEKMVNIKYRFGFTGTLDGSQTNQLVLEGLFGPVKSLIKTKELMESEQLANLKIKILLLKYSEQTRKDHTRIKYKDEMDFIVGNEKRNKFIQNLALSLNGNTLILFQYVEKHGKILYDLINSKANKDRKVFFVFGGTDGETRESVREITEKETNAIIIASYGTFSTGINIRALHNIIFASPSKSKIRNLQSIGRGLRTSENKERCTLFDIGDDLKYKENLNFTLKHLYERVKIYNQEKFDYKIHKIDLEE
tara:strand:+ start:1918 stop:3429 length:1512 start_codon:yes stop_codon:yes gene_type:complete